MSQQRVQPVSALKVGRFNVGGAADPHYLCPHQPRKDRDGGHSGGDCSVDGLETQRADDDHRQEEAGDGQQYVDETSQDASTQPPRNPLARPMMLPITKPMSTATSALVTEDAVP